ncbi:MAG: hypothetical protein KDA53_01650 [Hyphomonas sp.]|nr:hypothetical protein [Hyphomonas sp.]
MRLTTIAAAALLAGSLALAGCGKKSGVEGKTGDEITAKSSNDDIGEAYLNELGRIATALESIDDEASAKKAAKEINAASEGLNAMKEELGDLDGLRAVQIFGSRLSEMTRTQQRISVAMSDLYSNHPEYAELVGDEIDRLND